MFKKHKKIINVKDVIRLFRRAQRLDIKIYLQENEDMSMWDIQVSVIENYQEKINKMHICSSFNLATKKCKFVESGERKYGCEGSNLHTHKFWYASCILYRRCAKEKP